MASGGGRAAVIGAAVGALAIGAATGWLAAKSTIPPPPPPAFYRNPLADAAKDEVLVLTSPDGDTQAYRVKEASRDTVLLSVETVSRAGESTVQELRVARTFFGSLVILEGDIDPEQAQGTVRDFVIENMVPEELLVPSLERTLHCWKMTGTYRGMEPRTYWISDELPVHGIARIDGTRGKRYEVKSFSFGAKK